MTSETIEGEIVAVMESWPLQLTVETPTGRVQVGLQAGTVVTQGGQPSDPGGLRPGLRVRIAGERSGPGALSARSVELLS
jgi:hypothetical protein